MVQLLKRDGMEGHARQVRCGGVVELTLSSRGDEEQGRDFWGDVEAPWPSLAAWTPGVPILELGGKVSGVAC